jgi:antitoxin component YwqK of YwqJK toxin-antitoxin module
MSTLHRRVVVIPIRLCAIIIAFSALLFSGAVDNHLVYSIPSDAKKTGPFPFKAGSGSHVYRFYSKVNSLVGIDIVNKGKIVESILIKDHERHGVRRMWNQSGILILEEYYNHGVMHGIFRRWDDFGKPIGNWEMKNGTGKMILFYSHGCLREIREYKNNITDGLAVEFYPNGKMKNLGFYNSISLSGDYYEFGPKGMLTTIRLFNGPQIEIDDFDNYRVLGWYILGKAVSIEKYKIELNGGMTLFPLCVDYSKCLDQELDEIERLQQKYNSLPLWSVPVD